MRPFPAAAVLSALALAAFADRAARPMQLEKTGVAAPDGRFGVVGKKFVVRADTEKGACLRLFDLDVRDEGQAFFAFPEAPDAWWISPDGGHVAWTAAGVLHLSSTSGGDRTFGKAPASGVVFSAGGARLALVRDGAVIGVDVATGAVTAVPARKDRVLTGPPVLSGDGKRAYVLSGAADADAAAPDKVDCATFEAGSMLAAWSAEDGKIRGLSSAGALPTEDKRRLPPGSEDRLAFILESSTNTTACLFNAEDGSVTRILASDGLLDTALAPDASWVALLARARSGRVEAFAVDAQRSGSMREYASDRLAAIDDGDVASLRFTREGRTMLLLKPSKEEATPEVAGAGKRW